MTNTNAFLELLGLACPNAVKYGVENCLPAQAVPKGCTICHGSGLQFSRFTWECRTGHRHFQDGTKARKGIDPGTPKCHCDCSKCHGAVRMPLPAAKMIGRLIEEPTFHSLRLVDRSYLKYVAAFFDAKGYLHWSEATQSQLESLQAAFVAAVLGKVKV